MDTVIVVAGRSAARPKPGHRSTAYSDLFSSCSRSSAPSLVVPLEASEDDDALLYSARVSAVSASSLALIDSCSERPLRSMPVNLASIVPQTLRRSEEHESVLLSLKCIPSVAFCLPQKHPSVRFTPRYSV